MTLVLADRDRAGPARRPRSDRRTHARLRRLALPCVVIVVAALRLFVLEPVEVASSSMEPTLRAGDHVVTESISRRSGAIDRGDLVTFHAAETDELLLKRVAGVGGDTVAIRDGRLFVNRRLVSEPYVDHRTVDSVYFGPVLVPLGTLFVLGDNRALSQDSRDFGPVSRSDVVGTVFFTW